MRVDKRRCQHCSCAIERRANERPSEYKRRTYCSVQCLGQAKASKRMDRFWSRVDKRGRDECWPWMGRRSDHGYGQFATSDKQYRAHRFALESSGVIVPSEAIVMHSCDNPPCCNPAHLSVGTHAQNNADMMAKGRWKHPRGSSKLAPSDVLAIRASNDPLRTLAERFGVSRATVCRARSGKQWSHL